MVAAQVLREEVLLEDGAQEQPPKLALPGLASVDELVGGDDREARAATHHGDEYHHVYREEVLDCEHAGDPDDHGQLQGGEHVDKEVERPSG